MKTHDKNWYDFYAERCMFDDITYLNFDQDHLQKEKEKFFADQTYAPTFTYKIPAEKLDEHAHSLDELLEMVEADADPPELAKEAYRRKIDEQREKITLLRAIDDGNEKAFLQASQNIYGVPTEELMTQALSCFLFVVEKKEVQISEHLKEIADYFDAHAEKAELTFYDSAEHETNIESEAVKKMFETVLAEREINWAVLLKKDTATMSVNYTDKAVYIPENRKFSQVEAEALVAHEIDTHLARKVNGENSQLKLLGIGLDRYLKGEEGIAVWQQTRIDPSFFPGVGNYIAHGLVFGLYKDTPQDFGNIFNFWHEYLSIVSPHKAHKTNVWQRTVRTFRGLQSGQNGQYCFTRDLSYFQGLIEINRLVKTESSEVSRFNAGKYDPANYFHTKLLDNLNLDYSQITENRYK